MLPLTMKLPPPMSLNAYWRPVPIFGPGKKFLHTTMVPTAEAKAFKEDIGWRVKTYGITAPIAGRLQIDLFIYPQRPQDWQKRVRADPLEWNNTVRRVDTDNARKVMFDAFNGVLWVDDKWVFKDSAEIMEPDGEARTVVRVSRYVRERSPQLAIGGLL